jgi:hypothetical protein
MLDSSLTQRLRMRLDEAKPGYVWTPSDFLDLGGRDAVDKALQRRVASGDLRRIDRGLYDKPSFNGLTQKPAAPNPMAVINAVARRDQIRVLVDGMTAANDLGFTNAVPARIIVHADARLRPIKLGAMDISFKPTAASKLFWAGRPAMRLVQALHWLRDTWARDDEASDVDYARVGRLLSDPTMGAQLKTDLASGFTALPAWMQDTFRPFIADQLAAEQITGTPE